MKSALSLGLMNYLFPVTSISIKKKEKLKKIVLEYAPLNNDIRFVIGDKYYYLYGYIK